ncbi:Protein phosphatase [Parasponia andersonii]|uniref:Protein phosphatase n=1 Tax=Parasponia andersonii TaxID=3476 RepID=A0A2P5AMD9_PARAD|nr:Protein phosphatase [Parasponia andersonii]
MGLKDLPLKLKAFRMRRLLIGDGSKIKIREPSKPSWMTPISHGYHVVEGQSLRLGSDDSDSDSVVVQREQFDQLELWFFGVSDARIGDGVTKYMQSHFFDRKPKETTQIRRRGKEAMKKAYLGVRAKIKESQRAEAASKPGSVSVMVINGEKLVIANMGEYKAVLCRDGVARQIGGKHQQPSVKRHWSRRLLSGRTASTMQSKGLELLLGAERVDSDTEFVILASTGIWEAMKPQEAVNLIRHLEDPQEAAECLAKEAITRMSKSNISCLIIRFD